MRKERNGRERKEGRIVFRECVVGERVEIRREGKGVPPVMRTICLSVAIMPVTLYWTL